jgi:hypothetical protein
MPAVNAESTNNSTNDIRRTDRITPVGGLTKTVVCSQELLPLAHPGVKQRLQILQHIMPWLFQLQQRTSLN